MIPRKSLLNLGVLVVLVMKLQVRAMMVKYEEPFPARFPVHVKSRVAFTQYANVPMLSLDEIKNGFPWLQMSAESVADRKEGTHRSIKSGPRYVFYYVPTEVALHSGGSAKSYPGYQSTNSEPGLALDRQTTFQDKENDHSFQVKTNKPVQSKKEPIEKTNKPISRTKKLIEKLPHPDTEPPQTKSADSSEEKGRYDRYRDRDSDDRMGRQSETKFKSAKGGALLYLPKNHKFRDRDLPVETNVLNIAETRSMPSYLYPKVPSPYMQLPKLEFEEKEFWVKSKRKQKRPIKDLLTNEERLKNHRIVKNKKSKIINPEDDKRLRNHKPTYDREHDPEERVQKSSSGKVERLHRRPKENSKNPLLVSPDGERIEFQIHGHEGPQTYIFGYDTGDGENRHFRLEERLRDGTVKGHYGYYDLNGKLKMVEYRARPMGGYEEKHHKSNAYKSDQEDDKEIHS